GARRDDRADHPPAPATVHCGHSPGAVRRAVASPPGAGTGGAAGLAAAVPRPAPDGGRDTGGRRMPGRLVRAAVGERVLEGTTGAAIHCGLSGVGRPGVGTGRPAEAARVTALLYLDDLATRYLTDKQAEAGARLGVLGSWLLPVLIRRVGDL